MVEEQLRNKRIELSQIDVQRERMTQECDQIQQMLHTLSMTVEVGAAGIPGDDPTATEARSDGAMPLAPVAMPSDTKITAAEVAQAGAEITSTGSAEIRAGLKHIFKKIGAPADKSETVQTTESKAPIPA